MTLIVTSINLLWLLFLSEVSSVELAPIDEDSAEVASPALLQNNLDILSTFKIRLNNISRSLLSVTQKYFFL